MSLSSGFIYCILILNQTTMNIKNSAEQARKSISSYCYSECKSYCCRKGYLILSKSQVNTVTQGKARKLEEKGLLNNLKDGKYSMYMGDYSYPCQSLGNDFKCTIHKKRLRPKACRDFPIFVDGNRVMLSYRCPAVKEGKFYPFIRKWKLESYSVIESDALSDSDFYMLTKLQG